MKRPFYLLLKNVVFLICMFAFSTNAQVVINEVYGGGGNMGAVYKQDFVELFNKGTSSVDLTGYKIWYASPTGNFTSSVTLTGTIAAGGYYLIATTSPGTTGNNLPAPDQSSTSPNLGSENGNVLLTDSTFVSSSPQSCPSIGAIGVVDRIGYGTGVCYETTAAPALTNATSNSRNASHDDTGNNFADFSAGPPTPQASGATAANGTLSGKIKNQKGQGLRFCTVMLSGGSLPEPLYSTTNMFGQYRFEDIPLGEGYILQVFSRRYSFEEPSRFINLNQSISDADFTGDEQ